MEQSPWSHVEYFVINEKSITEVGDFVYLWDRSSQVVFSFNRAKLFRYLEVHHKYFLGIQDIDRLAIIVLGKNVFDIWNVGTILSNFDILSSI